MQPTSNARLFRFLSVSYAAISVFLFCGFDGGCSFWNTPPSGSPAPATVQGFETRNTTVLPWSTSTVTSSSPRPYQPIRGGWSVDDVNPIGSVESFGLPNGNQYTAYTDTMGNYTVDNLRQNANWVLGINYLPNGCKTSAAKFPYQTPPGMWWFGYYIAYQNPPIHIDCPRYVTDAYQGVLPQFSLNTALPATLSVNATAPLSSTYGAPQLLVFNRTGSIVATENASSIDSTGLSASFPFPAASSGALAPDMYGTAVLNTNSDGTQSYAGGGNFFSIGNFATNYPSAFGVAAAESTSNIQVCISIPVRPYFTCTSSVQQNHYPVVTLAENSAVSWNERTVYVGSTPVAIATYGTGSTSSTQTSGSTRTTVDTSGTAYAIVANSQSNSVSILNLLTPGVIATVSVGKTPVAVSLSPDSSLAYVANYGDSTVSVLNLSTNSVIGTYPVGMQPLSLNVDGSGNLWVGGVAYIKELSVSTYQVLQSISVSGEATSLAVSATQGQVLVTIAPVSGNSGALVTQAYSTSSGQVLNSSSIGNIVPYVSSAISSQLVSPAQLGTGTLVSANYGNDLAISASPGGFVVTEVSTGGTIMTGTTPNPIRAIAVDPNYGEVYLTVPDNNAVITVPLPPVPSS